MIVERETLVSVSAPMLHHETPVKVAERDETKLFPSSTKTDITEKVHRMKIRIVDNFGNELKVE